MALPEAGAILDAESRVLFSGGVLLDPHGRSGLFFPTGPIPLPEDRLKSASVLSFNGKTFPIRNLQPRPERFRRLSEPHYDFDIDFGV